MVDHKNIKILKMIEKYNKIKYLYYVNKKKMK